MTKMFHKLMIATVLFMAVCSVALAQQQPQPEKIPVKLQIVLSRYYGDRRISSLPYTLLTTANGPQTSLLLGTNVPIVTSVASAASSDGKTPSTTSYSYTNVGTSIQCTVTTEAGRFKVVLLIDDKTVVDAKPATGGSANTGTNDKPSFRDFNYNGTLSMKEGESKQIATAADRTSSEVVKIDVTLTLDK